MAAASTRKTRTFTVTRVDKYTVDGGEIPSVVLAKMIEEAANQWIPALFLADTDFSLGESGDFGNSTNETIEVDYSD